MKNKFEEQYTIMNFKCNSFNKLTLYAILFVFSFAVLKYSMFAVPSNITILYPWLINHINLRSGKDSKYGLISNFNFMVKLKLFTYSFVMSSNVVIG